MMADGSYWELKNPKIHNLKHVEGYMELCPIHNQILWREAPNSFKFALILKNWANTVECIIIKKFVIARV